MHTADTETQDLFGIPWMRRVGVLVSSVMLIATFAFALMGPVGPAGATSGMLSTPMPDGHAGNPVEPTELPGDVFSLGDVSVSMSR